MNSIRLGIVAWLVLGTSVCGWALAQPLSAEKAQTRSSVLALVEANRPRIVERLVDAHGPSLVAQGVPLDAFRAALWDLPPERLLEASLSDSPEAVNAIVAQTLAGAARPVEIKDGAGSGANSWIGYTAGGNVASGTGSAVAAGTSNAARGTNSFVGAGTFNAANGQGSFVGGGTSNVANATSSLVMGGFDNQATVIDSVVVAGAGNRALGARSVVVGGGYNVASGQWSFVGGGGRQTGSGIAGANPQDNVASGDISVVAGGQGNHASGFAATVSGGEANVASDDFSTVAGGGSAGTCSSFGVSRLCANGASAVGATVGGGLGNLATALGATVGGGIVNAAAGEFAVVTGGTANSANGIHSVVGGGAANAAMGDNSIALGGDQNVAGGSGSLAAGHRAHATTVGSFIWADQQDFDFAPSVANFFGVRATGGVGFTVAVNPSTGAVTQFCNLLPGTPSWQCTSDRAAKENFAPVDGHEILQRLADMPLYFWNFKGADPAIRSLGPTAQDFYAAFGLGDTDKAIAGANVEGVALAAIQGLKREVDERNAEIDALRQRLDAMESRLLRLSTSTGERAAP